MRKGVVVGVVALGALTGACAPASESTQTQSQPPASSSSQGASSSPGVSDPQVSPTAIPSDAVDYYSGERVDTAKPAAVWDEAARAAALEAGTTVLELFARPTLPSAEWWAALAPVLSEQAQLDYADTDPAQVPAHQVTGAARLVETSSALIATVEVPTDVGTYTVVLSRDAADQAWLAERITPPPSAE